MRQNLAIATVHCVRPCTQMLYKNCITSNYKNIHMKGEVTLRKRIIYKQINTFLARIEKMCVDIQLLDIY